MAEQKNRYQQMESIMACALGVDLLLFIVYLIAAGAAVVWLKIVAAIFVFILSIACVGYLYLTKELFKRRSFWMVVAACALVLCTVLSLILSYPSPNPLKDSAEVLRFMI